MIDGLFLILFVLVVNLSPIIRLHSPLYTFHTHRAALWAPFGLDGGVWKEWRVIRVSFTYDPSHSRSVQ